MKTDVTNIIQLMEQIRTYTAPAALRMAVIYGSRERDIDIFLVTNMKSQNPYRPSVIDIYHTDHEDFIFRLNMLDPVATEPILTGEAFVGHMLFSKAADMLKLVKPSLETSSHLKSQARTLLDIALAQKGSYEDSRQPNNLLYALVNLSYVCSYIVFERIYASDNYSGPITLEDAISYDIAAPIAGLRNVIKHFYMGDFDHDHSVPLSHFQAIEKWARSELTRCGRYSQHST